MRTIYLVSISLLISGCAPFNWKHPTNSQTDFYRDTMQCETYATQIVQGAIVALPTPYRDSAYNTVCQGNAYTNSVNCTTERDRSFDNYDRGYQQGQAIGNSLFGGLAKRRHYANCMRSLGYTD